MKTINEALAFGIKSSKGMIDAFTADLTGKEWEHRAVPGSNCAAWLVGHLILTDRNVLKTLGITDLPELPAGFETRFSRAENAPHAESFGDPAILVPLFDKHRDMVTAAIMKMPAAQFDEALPKPHPRFSKFGEYLAFMTIHVVTHAGQISTIRRSLGRPPLF